MANAEEQQHSKAFRAIIAKTNKNMTSTVLIIDDLDESNPLWHTEKEKVIPRKAYELAGCARMLLNFSQEILIIDPHFEPQIPRFRETFSYLVEFALDNRQPVRIEIHVENKMLSPSLDEWRKRCCGYLAPLLPVGKRVTVFRWQSKDKGDKPHARYILTERGGIRYDYGIDEWEGEGQTTDVALLDPSLYEQRWRDYQKETAAFDLVDEIPIVGTKALSK